MFARAGVLTTAFIALAMGSVGAMPSTSAGPAILATPFPATLENCVDCANCGDNGNKAFPGDSTSWFELGGGTHSKCYYTGLCVDQHPPTCNLQQEDEEEMLAQLESLRKALAAGAWQEVRVLLSAGSDRIVYDREREAIQAIGCEEQVLVHLPVRASLLGE